MAVVVAVDEGWDAIGGGIEADGSGGLGLDESDECTESGRVAAYTGD